MYFPILFALHRGGKCWRRSSPVDDKEPFALRCSGAELRVALARRERRPLMENRGFFFCHATIPASTNRGVRRRSVRIDRPTAEDPETKRRFLEWFTADDRIAPPPLPARECFKTYQSFPGVIEFIAGSLAESGSLLHPARASRWQQLQAEFRVVDWKTARCELPAIDSSTTRNGKKPIVIHEAIGLRPIAAPPPPPPGVPATPTRLQCSIGRAAVFRARRFLSVMSPRRRESASGPTTRSPPNRHARQGLDEAAIKGPGRREHEGRLEDDYSQGNFEDHDPIDEQLTPQPDQHFAVPAQNCLGMAAPRP